MLPKTSARIVLNAPKSPDDAKRARRAAVNQFHARLAAECPRTFCAFDHAPRVALAIGMRHQLAERYPDTASKTRILFLKEYTSSAVYLRLLKPDAPRVDIDGSVTGTVTEAESEHAAEKLKKLLRTTGPQKRGE